jgi:putative glutamine amidotransferase
MERPMIGVLPLYDSEKESYWMLPGYMKGIEAAGGIAVVLPLTSNEEIIQTLADHFDGFLFTGGHDIHPELYGERVEPVCGELCNERDVMERLLFERVTALDKPAFGICRGLQLFNALLGGTLYQDLPTQLTSDVEIEHKQRPPYTTPAHKVYIEQGSLLEDLLHKESIEVNSYHHQGIKKLSEQLLPLAKAEDGLVEAVMMPNKKFVLAVQWHPEFSYESDDPSFTLFEEFVRSCKEKSA